MIKLDKHHCKYSVFQCLQISSINSNSLNIPNKKSLDTSCQKISTAIPIIPLYKSIDHGTFHLRNYEYLNQSELEPYSY